MKAVILVAGYATRLFPLTENTPKALLEFWGKPILNYIFENMEEIDEIDEVYIVSNSRFYDNFLKWSKTLRTSKVIHVVDDGTDSDSNKLGAIGDLNMLLNSNKIDDDMMVLLGDNLFTYSLLEFYKYFKKVNSDCICVKRVSELEELQRIGVVELENNQRVISFEEKPKVPKSDLGAFGAYIYKKDTLPMVKTYVDEGNNVDAPGNLPAWLCKRKDVYAYVFEGECFDIGTVASYKEVRENYKYLFVK